MHHLCMCRKILQGAYKNFPQKGGKLWTQEMGNCCSYHPWGKEAQTPGLACTHMAPHQLSRNWVCCSQEMQKADMSLIFPYTFSSIQKLKLKLKILSEKLRQTPLQHKILSQGKSRGRFDSSTFPRTLNHPFHSWLLAVIKRHRQNASRISMQSIFFFLLFKNKLEKKKRYEELNETLLFLPNVRLEFLRVQCCQRYAGWGMLPLLQTWTASVRRKRSWLIKLILPELIKQWDVLGFCCLSWWVLIITISTKPQHVSLGSKLPSNVFPLKINSIVMEPVY